MDCDVSDIETKYIEGEPEIGSVGVHAETTNPPKSQKGSKIHGISNENATDTEGKVTFDIRFYALTPADERVILIINVEAQNDFYPGYSLIKRAIYYGCRQISAQYGSEFEKAEYGNIKKVYSLWICFDSPQNRRNTITMYKITEKQLVGEVYEDVACYDLMSVIMICLGTSKDERYTGLLKLLDVWMSGLSIQDKGAVLKSEFHTDLPERLLEKEVKMCNYSAFVENRGIRKGKAEALVNLMKKLKLSLEQALDTLSIPETEWDEYRALVAQLEAQPAR